MAKKRKPFSAIAKDSKGRWRDSKGRYVKTPKAPETSPISRDRWERFTEIPTLSKEELKAHIEDLIEEGRLAESVSDVDLDNIATARVLRHDASWPIYATAPLPHGAKTETEHHILFAAMVEEWQQWSDFYDIMSELGFDDDAIRDEWFSPEM